MQVPRKIRSSLLREFLDNSAAGGPVLMAAAALALVVANSPSSSIYFALQAYLGPLSIQHWINDALMAVFFLLVGFEIKREMLDVKRR